MTKHREHSVSAYAAMDQRKQEIALDAPLRLDSTDATEAVALMAEAAKRPKRPRPPAKTRMTTKRPNAAEKGARPPHAAHRGRAARLIGWRRWPPSRLRK